MSSYESGAPLMSMSNAITQLPAPASLSSNTAQEVVPSSDSVDDSVTASGGSAANNNAHLLHPLGLLMDELKSEEVTLRLNAIRRLSTISLALGPARSREELLPFLHDSLDDEDEVLLVLAEELGNLVDYLGGPSNAHLLLGPLETLAAVEETLVRDKAAESINKIAKILSQPQIEEHYLPLLRRLSTGDWFTSRTSATALYGSAYPKATTTIQDEMRKMFSSLCTDETPMVRRAAAKEYGPFSKVLDKHLLITEMLPVFRKLSTDDQDSVRLLTVEALIAMAQALNDEECNEYLEPTMKNMVSDSSWRVRYMIADHFVELSTAAGEDIIREDLVAAFVHLLKDNEAEVRTVAAAQIPGFAKLVDKDVILARLLPCVKDLATDTSQHVRAALGTQISGLAPLLGKEATIEHLLPLFLQLLKDDFPDVRLNIISKLEQVNDVIGIELLSQALLPAIMQLAEDKQWRVRQAIIDYIPLLANQLGVRFFDEQLSNLCMTWLGDPVYSIREAATVNLRKLTEVFGVQWAREAIIPKVLAMGSNSNYLFRMTTVFAITTMATALDVQTISTSVLETVNRLVEDPIPNIRFATAKCLGVLAQTVAGQEGGKEVARDGILPGLQKLKEDSDPDVRFFANEAIEAAHAVASGHQVGARDSEMSISS
ncbi:uncharacterized protein L969DRAFT_86165 [Mixia osmundae IAM 14324]|uniref:Phosphatase PP2A regulatory subunit A/Splicing factor 3B subunit 1-like HEAT repeat domain-containing protein n=1 Tax=Mixia osmundae (strain CBS 9802 / IAM 14324 / JCM 22182 / KY 12970) TaxID=764103 RepID=G7DSA3_MIXOS|nr:uncharacterized protein L969DRAFT_86165 [Mixia osmundae IAM 14324]KEI40915.1 hypothetical protein L969DRAFT_86165 [Mixia osmundae IAM 14324]GAA93463.1 hypothetical protein E5Q_00104 [Mixia osmundae IAM 14324]